MSDKIFVLVKHIEDSSMCSSVIASSFDYNTLDAMYVRLREIAKVDKDLFFRYQEAERTLVYNFYNNILPLEANIGDAISELKEQFLVTDEFLLYYEEFIYTIEEVDVI